jgi:hypothetical protein
MIRALQYLALFGLSAACMVGLLYGLHWVIQRAYP